MSPPQKNRLLHTLFVLLLSGSWAANGAHNDTETGKFTPLAPVQSRSYILAREGSSTLLECNVTADQVDVRWYNSKGLLLGDEQGMGEFNYSFGFLKKQAKNQRYRPRH